MASRNGYALLKAGRLEEAASCCRQALKDSVDDPELMHVLGLVAYQQGEYPAALEWFSKAVSRSPRQPHYRNHLGLALSAAGDHSQAVCQLRLALRLAPGNASILGNLGLALRQTGALKEAESSFREAIRLAPEDADHHFNLGNLLADLGRYAEAEHCYRLALRLRPGFGKACNSLGNTLRALGRTGEAIEKFQKALQAMPDSIGAMNNLGNALRADGRFGEAEGFYRQALALGSASAETWCNLGNVLSDSRRFEEALECYNQAIALQPGYAEVYFNRACLRLLRGDWAAAWEDYEWRLERPVWKSACTGRLALPRWRGGPFTGRRLLVYDEQGLGDTIQFARFLPVVKALGGEVMFETRANLMPLFRDFNGIDRLLERRTPEHPSAEADLYVPLLSLPGLLGTTINTIPWDGPYLRAEPACLNRWRSRFGQEAYRIGVVWSGSNVDPHRACPPQLLEALAQFPGGGWYGLQKDGLAPHSEKNPAGFVQLGPCFADFGDTAAAIAHLDLVISVDTAVAHLSGAMGKPTWVLLPYTADWRWFVDREDSPWYPTMRLFRQQAWGDWQGVVKRVVRELDRTLRASGIRHDTP